MTGLDFLLLWLGCSVATAVGWVFVENREAALMDLDPWDYIPREGAFAAALLVGIGSLFVWPVLVIVGGIGRLGKQAGLTARLRLAQRAQEIQLQEQAMRKLEAELKEKR